MYWIALTTVLVLILGYICFTYFQADTEVKNAPREDMVECHAGRHGVYPKKYGIASNDYGTKEPVIICPFCYDEACKQALHENGLNKNSQTHI
jgi:hypothetical protein